MPESFDPSVPKNMDEIYNILQCNFDNVEQMIRL